jgi:hypothetical protein
LKGILQLLRYDKARCQTCFMFNQDFMQVWTKVDQFLLLVEVSQSTHHTQDEL